MIEPAIQRALDPGFDLAKIEQHAVVAQLAIQYRVNLPATADQAALGTPKRDVYVRQLVNE
ncbi:hypothetical protein HVA01_28770 [Halovibrio variabilis]|uniref:Uncharacterized protein n=1 Tax=Halovibrio variabilis TaxID=31910 RepID=A0A511UTE2_9GAMM|nr:hypothetical protein HVA01_28770 [Halovibrio variabilis]